MKLLLDTHIWVWSALSPKRLSARVARALTNPENQLWLSPVSVWEFLLLHARGRVELDEEARPWIHKTLTLMRLLEAPITIEVAMETAVLATALRDPADCYLAASAKVLGLTLVTADERLARQPDIRILPNH